MEYWNPCHDRLVLRAGKWLRGKAGGNCHVVALERRSRAGLIPDAIGWGLGGFSRLVECKTSRGDFFADQKKVHRREGAYGVGWKRYYFTPPYLIEPEEVPTKWGLAYCYESGVVRTVKNAGTFQLSEIGQKKERQLLIAQIKTIQRGHTNFQGEPLIGHPDYEVASRPEGER